jgi:polyhydroxyalkanoate synthase
VHANLLAFAGRTDRIAPAAAVRTQVDAVGSRDVSYKLAPGGHIGVFAGRAAPKHVWEPLAAWLEVRSAARPLPARRGSRAGVARRTARGAGQGRRAAHD